MVVWHIGLEPFGARTSNSRHTGIHACESGECMPLHASTLKQPRTEGLRWPSNWIAHHLAESTKRKTGAEPTPSSKKLAQRYFRSITCLRQRVKNRRSGQVMGRERIKVAFFGVVHPERRAGDEVLWCRALVTRAAAVSFISGTKHINLRCCRMSFAHFCNYFGRRLVNHIQAENSARLMNPPGF